MTDTVPEAGELVSRLEYLVSLNEPENGGPYGGFAAQECVRSMRDAIKFIRAIEPVERGEAGPSPAADSDELTLDESIGFLLAEALECDDDDMPVSAMHYRRAAMAIEQLANPPPADSEVTAEMVEAAAEAMWRAEPNGTILERARAQSVWSEEAPDLRARWCRFARAALLAARSPAPVKEDGE